MRRARTHHVLLLIALLHLFADAAFAGGVVLCVGPDDHRALESERSVDFGCEALAPSANAQRAELQALPGDCDDSPVHSDAEMVSKEQESSGSTPGQISLLVSLDFRTSLAPRAGLTLATASGRAPELRALRTTVLLL